jgi:hypothetical protein
MKKMITGSYASKGAMAKTEKGEGKKMQMKEKVVAKKAMIKKKK